MTSIIANATGRVHQTTGITTGSFSFGEWWKLPTPSDGDIVALFNNDQSQGLGFYRYTSGADIVVGAYVYGTGDDSVDIINPFDGDWIWVGGTHAAASAVYKLYFLAEGDVSLFTATLTAGGAISAEEIGFFDAYGASTGVGQGRSGFFRTDELSAADMLTASQSLSPPAGTNLIAYAFSSAATANDNIGTGADGTLTATFTDDSSEPAVGNAAPQLNNLFFGSM